jgi:hypothetical protein
MQVCLMGMVGGWGGVRMGVGCGGASRGGGGSEFDIRSGAPRGHSSSSIGSFNF